MNISLVQTSCSELQFVASDSNPCYITLKKIWLISPLKSERRLLYLKTQSVPRCKHFSSLL